MIQEGEGEGTSDSVCFICLEACTRNPVCACTNMPCHMACQRALIATSRSCVCPVCKEPFTNVKTIERVVIGWDWCAFFTLISVTFVTSAALFCLYAWYSYWLLGVEAVVCLIVGGCVTQFLRPTTPLARAQFVVHDQTSPLVLIDI